MKRLGGEQPFRLTRKGPKMVGQAGAPFDMQEITGLQQPAMFAAAASFDHAGMVAMMLGQSMKNGVMLSMPLYGQNQAGISPLYSHGLIEIGQGI